LGSAAQWFESSQSFEATRTAACSRRDWGKISEALAVRCGDLYLTHPYQGLLHRKGRKGLLSPLSRETALGRQRPPAVRDAKPDDFVFVNRKREPLSRDSVAYELRKYVPVAVPEAPTLHRHKLPPHLPSHGGAVAILQAGTDITVTVLRS
jgi:site-specific recombinase XerD